VFHNITPEKVLFCHREGDPDSLDLAMYYKYYRGVPLENNIALPCSLDQTITEAEYIYQIRDPIIAALDELEVGSDGHFRKDIWVIILGYHIPNFYTDAYGQRIPIASRVQRIREPYTGKVLNHTYNKQIFEYFTDEDIDNFFITAVMDGPSVSAVKAMMNSAIVAQNSDVITGKVYLDPYGQRLLPDHLAYRDELYNFQYDYLPYLGLDYEVTAESAFDPTFRSFLGDAFYWGWFTPYCPRSIFSTVATNRIFMYNADSQAAANIRSVGATESIAWCNVSQQILPAYAASAGATEDPGIDAYLRPEPFFRALHLGATLGEAFMSSSKYLDWKIILIGDPLLSVTFPLQAPPDPYGPASSPPSGNVPGVVEGDLLESSQVSQSIKDRIEDSMAYRSRAAAIAVSAVNRVVDSEDENENALLLNPLVQWREELLRQEADIYSRSISKWFTYTAQSNRSTINGWFDTNCQKTTQAFADSLLEYTNSTIQTEYVYSEDGFWSVTFYYIHPIRTAEKVHFELQILDYLTSEVVFQTSTLSNSTGWEYESRTNKFTAMTDGFFSSHSGRRARYSAPEENYLSPLEIYRVRWRPMHDDATPISGFVDMTDLLIVKSSEWAGSVATSPDDTVVFYANAFGLMLHAGQAALSVIADAITYIKQVSTSSMPVYNLQAYQQNKGFYPLQQRNELVAALRDLQVVLKLYAYSRKCYPKAFQSLYRYVEQTYGVDIDTYLTDNGLQVDQTFATVSDSLGEPISAGNIMVPASL
jgi:uncharacterized protein (TIGR03790 family)